MVGSGPHELLRTRPRARRRVVRRLPTSGLPRVRRPRLAPPRLPRMPRAPIRPGLRISLGAAAIGFSYAIGGGAIGPAIIDGRRCDPAALDFVRRWLSFLGTPPSCR